MEVKRKFPTWLKVKMPNGENYEHLKNLVQEKPKLNNLELDQDEQNQIDAEQNKEPFEELIEEFMSRREEMKEFEEELKKNKII